MDVKALAKSKRAHTQHHSRRSHGPRTNQKPNTPSDATENSSSAKKPSGKQVGEKTHRSQGAPKLPSNWDRYEEEFEDPSGSGGASQPSDVILPKSKGADYCHLIAEAQSQSESQSSLYLDRFPSLDDVMPELNQGLGPMLSVRGEGILSWIGNNNFVVEDKTAAAHEASFLSLNLHVLAEKLENIDLPQRLFIEADLLPPELWTEGSKASSSLECDQINTCCSEVSTAISEEYSEKVKIADENTRCISSGPCGSSNADTSLFNQGLITVNDLNVELKQIFKSSQSEVSQPTEEFNMNTISEPQKKLSSFEAAAAEKELEMLLDSFSEVKKIGNPSDAFPVLKQEASMAPSIASKRGPYSSVSTPVIADFDDALNDLLEETSNVVNPDGVSQSLEGKAFVLPAVQSSSSYSETKSKVLDDFDSWLDTM